MIIVKIILHLFAIVFLTFCFLFKVSSWLSSQGFMGWDTPQFIYYVFYYLRHLNLPHLSWDHLWFMGIPRVLDMTFIHFYLIQTLVKKIGIYLAVKFYPLIFAYLLIIFSYFCFYLLSKSQIVAFVLGIVLTLSDSIYYPLFSDGIVLSFISQAFFPITLFFLILFSQQRKIVFFYLAAVFSALGIYSHGANQLFFNLLPSLIFLIFLTEDKKIPFLKNLGRAIFFLFLVFFLGALGIFPQLNEALKAGSYGSAPFTGLERKPDTFLKIWQLTNKGIFGFFFVGLLIGFLSGFKNLPESFYSIFFILIYFFLWSLASYLGLNPLVGFLFTTRTLWFLAIIMGSASAVLFSLLFFQKEKKRLSFLIKLFSFIAAVSFSLPLFSEVKTQKFFLAKRDAFKDAKKDLAYITSFIKKEDVEKKNYRIWSHSGSFNNSWGMVYDMPLVEGYFHFYTKEAEPWQGWFYGTVSRANWLTQEIPKNIALPQSLFFIDWYAVKYFVTGFSDEILDIAPYFYEKNNYISRQKVIPGYPGLLEVNKDFTSGIIQPTNVPVVGFIGSDLGYQSFLKNLATLNLNTAYLVPVKVAKNITSVSLKDLQYLDALVVYDFSDGSPFYFSGLKKIEKFVKDGGLLWIETGGNSKERENKNLPFFFPIKKNYYGSLGKNWEADGELAKKVDFSQLSPLIYRGSPWKISYTTKKEIKEGGRVLLYQKGYPVAVISGLSKGKVLWTGVNFWYRQEEYRKNAIEETKVIKALLEELLGKLEKKRVFGNFQREKPEKINFQGEKFNGLVFKENYSPGWKAEIIADKKVDGKIFIAGPGLMYIALPKDLREKPLEIRLNYQGEFIHHLAFYLAIISFLAVGDLIFGGLILKRLGFLKLKDKFENFYQKIINWWKTEDEEV